MSDNSHEIKSTIQPWIVSLGISVFCCALFFAFMSTYVGSINHSLNQIDERLANIEARSLSAATQPTPVVEAPSVPQPAPQPVVQEPVPPSVAAPEVGGVDSPSATAPSVQVPSAAPAPEAVAPVLPSVPANAAPLEVPTKQ